MGSYTWARKVLGSPSKSILKLLKNPLYSHTSIPVPGNKPVPTQQTMWTHQTCDTFVTGSILASLRLGHMSVDTSREMAPPISSDQLDRMAPEDT